jgi:hypothetical protein
MQGDLDRQALSDKATIGRGRSGQLTDQREREREAVNWWRTPHDAGIIARQHQ